MMKLHSSIWKVYIYSLYTCLLIMIMVIVSYTTGYAQEPATLSVMLMIVPETEACKPDGYASYASGVASTCETVRIADVELWKDLEYTYIIQDIPPEEIALKNKLFLLLDAYRTASKDDPQTRKAVVMVFDWKEPQSLSIELQRKDLKNRGIPDLDKTWLGKLDGERRWIHHERADSFLPAYNIRWILRAGEEQWTLKTTRTQ